LELIEVSESFYNYEVITSDGKKRFASKDIKHYQGVITDIKNSIVAITFYEDEIIGFISTDEGNFNIVKDYQSGKHIFYNEQNLKEKSYLTCGTANDFSFLYDSKILSKQRSILSEGASAIQTNLINKQLRYYVEVEYDIYQIRGNISSVEAFIAGLFNQVAVLYQNEDILTRVSCMYIWISNDPYTGANTSSLLSQFQNTRTSINGDLGILLTYRVSGWGIAAAVHNALCLSSTGQKLAVAGISSTYSPCPTYSETVNVVTHEFGHLFNSRHTHACVWNGNNTAIDGCVDTEPPTPDGATCPKPGIPSNGGTIMSYCQQTSVGVNFNLGFGPQPGNVIRSSYNSAGCLPTVTISGPSVLEKYETSASYSSLLAGTWSITSPLSIYSGQGTNSIVVSKPYGWPGIDYATLSLTPRGAVSAITKQIELPRDCMYVEIDVSPAIIYPNPATDVVNVELQNIAPENDALSGEYSVRLYNRVGILQKELTVMASGKTSVSFSVSGLANGLYLLYLYPPDKGKPHVTKLIVKH
jgi:hypothetical protein